MDVITFLQILTMIGGVGVLSFILFLLGYTGYSIVKRGKRKKLIAQQKYEKKETERLEWYLRNMDNDLKKEIEQAVKEHNIKKGIVDTDENNTADDNLSNDLTEKIKEIIGKKIEIWLNKGEEKYKELNDRHNFDKDNENLNKIKKLIQEGISKFASNIDKWDRK